LIFNLRDYKHPKEKLNIAVNVQKDAERLVLQRESRYQAFFQHAADAVFVFDFDGRLLDVNNQACNSLGYSSEELLGMSVTEIIPKFDTASRDLLWGRLKIGQPNCVISSHRRKDGKIFPVEMRLTVLDLEGEKLVMALVSDITERKRNESALQESVAFSESLLQTMTVPVFYKNTEGRYTGCNSAFAEFIGKTKEEIIGKTVFDISPQKLSPVYRDKDLELLEAPEGVQIYESRVMHADGTHHDVIFHKARIANSSGELTGIIGAILDISERKRYEEEQLNLIRQLEKKELAKTRFLASAGHDLRQPVSAASLFVHALKLTSPTPSQNELIEKLDESMQTFSDLLDQLLNISKFDAGLIKPEPSVFSLVDLFSWLEHNFAQAALDKQLCFRFHFPLNKSLILRTDIGLLKSVLMNLLSNAIKFTSHGGVLVSARVHGDQLKLQVWDTGIGIPEANLSHIFDEFYQVNNPQRDRNRGLGLGLSIVKRALTLLGGEIAYRSTISKGTVFGFCLPLDSSISSETKQAATELLSEDILDDTFARGKRFVVVEDDALVAHALISWLEGMGGNVQFFLSAEDALESEQIGQADYFIADYMLGGAFNGIQFLNQLYQKLGKPINAVLVTGDTSPAFVHAAAHCDWSVLYKPVNPAKLIECLREQKEGKKVGALSETDPVFDISARL